MMTDKDAQADLEPDNDLATQVAQDSTQDGSFTDTQQQNEDQDKPGGSSEEGESQNHDEPDEPDIDPKKLQQQLKEIQEERDQLKKQVSNGSKAYHEHQRRQEELERQVQELRAQREAAVVPAYDPSSPRHEEYQRKVPIVEAYLRAAREAPDADSRQAVVNSFSSIITDDDVRTYEEGRRYWSDPARTQQIARQEAQQTFQQMSVAERQREEMRSFLNDNKDVLEGHWDDLQTAMENGQDPRTYVLDLKSQAKDAKLQEALRKAQEAEARLKAKEDALRGDATVSRDLVAGKTDDPNVVYDEALKTWKESHNGAFPDMTNRDWIRHRAEVERRLTQ